MVWDYFWFWGGEKEGRGKKKGMPGKTTLRLNNYLL